jgi:hypothetical protein
MKNRYAYLGLLCGAMPVTGLLARRTDGPLQAALWALAVAEIVTALVLMARKS